MEKDRTISLQRAEELRKRNLPYEEARRHIARGTDPVFVDRYIAQKDRILTLLGATEDEWDDWKWQFENRIDSLDKLEKVLKLTRQEKQDILAVSGRYRWAITPYYLALINPRDPLDPVRMMSIPSALELDETGYVDPMDEEHTNPAGVITQRYPDRLILNVTNACAMFCRHCQRRRHIGENDHEASVQLLKESVAYIRQHKEIRDVLITGGDPLTLQNGFLDALISRIREIPHVEIIRIGTRTVVTMPQRITPELVGMLRKYHPLYINVQFNHPQEITREVLEACGRLADAGIQVGNQMVLLEGVNNNKHIVRLLNHELLKARVRPYYIFHAKEVIGTRHFQTSVDDGLEIMNDLRGNTSGMAIPTYILNAPGGLGKIPLLPDYIQERTDETVTLRTWEGKIVTYPNKKR